MKTLAAILALVACSCAEWAGNGVSVSATYEDPETGVEVVVSTAK